MENDWKKGIADLKKINLTKGEKDSLLVRVLAPGKNLPIKSPWLTFVGRHYLPIASVLVVLVVGIGLVDFSRKSLPGDKLYNFKVQIVEPAQDFVKILPAEDAVWQAEKAVRRLEEAELLMSEGKLDEKKKTEIEFLFNKHAQKFNESLNKGMSSSTLRENKKEIEKIEIKKEESTKKVREIIERKLESTKKIKAKSQEKSSSGDKGRQERYEPEKKEKKD